MKIQRFVLVLTSLNIVLAAVVLFQGQAVTAQVAPAVIRAQAIELVDGRGRVRAQLNVEMNGEAVFRLRDEQGSIRVKLGASELGSGLLLLDESQEPGVHIVAQREGTSLTVKKGDRQQVVRP